MLHDLVMVLGIANLLSFLMFGLDKYLSIRKKRRISERTLILSALFGGSFGAITAQHLFRHKTRNFRIILPAILILHLAAAGVVWYTKTHDMIPYSAL